MEMCGFVDEGTGLSGGRSYEPIVLQRQRGKVARHSSHTFVKLFTEFNMLRDHGCLQVGIVVQRVGDGVPPRGGGKLDRNIAVLDLLNIVTNDIQVGVISERGLDERCMLLVIRVCDNFFHYTDLSVSLKIKVKMRQQLVK